MPVNNVSGCMVNRLAQRFESLSSGSSAQQVKSGSSAQQVKCGSTVSSSVNNIKNVAGCDLNTQKSSSDNPSSSSTGKLINNIVKMENIGVVGDTTPQPSTSVIDAKSASLADSALSSKYYLADYFSNPEKFSNDEITEMATKYADEMRVEIESEIKGQVIDYDRESIIEDNDIEEPHDFIKCHLNPELYAIRANDLVEYIPEAFSCSVLEIPATEVSKPLSQEHLDTVFYSISNAIRNKVDDVADAVLKEYISDYNEYYPSA